MPSCATPGIHQLGLRSHGLPSKNERTPLIDLLKTGSRNGRPPVVISHDNGAASIEDATKTHPHPRLQVRPSAGKGLGLFAVSPIPAYTPILTDDPLLALAAGEDLPELWQKYLALPPDFQEQFDSLSCTATAIEKEDGLISKLQALGYDETTAIQMARVSSKFQMNAFKGSGNSKIGRAHV